MSGVPPDAGGRRRLAAALAALVAFVVVLPVIRNGWTNWDDAELLLEHAQWRGLGPDHLRWMWTSFRLGHYQPLTWMSYAIDHALWGLNAAGVHLGNAVLHAVTTALLTGILMRWLRRGGNSSPALEIACATGALLWALHPQRVEVVAWATARRDALSAAAAAAAVFVWLGPEPSAPPGPWRRAGATAWALGAMLAKAQAMVLPALLMIVDAVARPGGGWRRRWRATWWLWLAAAAVASVSAVAALSSGAMIPWSVHGAMARLVQAGHALGWYAGRTLAPFRLSPLYPLPRPYDPAVPGHWIPALVAVAGLAGVAIVARRHPPAAAAAGWSVVSLAPVLGIAQAGPQFVADRYTYLAAWPVAAAVAAGLLRLGRRGRAREAAGRLTRTLGFTAVLIVLGICAARTRDQIAVWRDSLTLWRHVLSLYPDCAIAHNNLAHALEEAGDPAGALEHFTAAVEADPALPGPLAGRATLLGRLGQAEEARREFDAVLAMAPNHAGALLGRANLDLAAGRTNDAIAGYRAALAARPELVDADYNLATVLLRLGDVKEAQERLERVVRLQPEHAPAWHNLGIAYQRLGDPAAARAAYERALRLDPAAARLHVPREP